jgi:hypothetical protein
LLGIGSVQEANQLVINSGQLLWGDLARSLDNHSAVLLESAVGGKGNMNGKHVVKWVWGVFLSLLFSGSAAKAHRTQPVSGVFAGERIRRSHRDW